jgi:hypothetical protein
VSLIPAGMTLELADDEATLTIPKTGVCWTGDVTVDWGDGTPAETVTTATATHTYLTNGPFDVLVSSTPSCPVVEFPVIVTAAAAAAPAPPPDQPIEL